MRTILAVVIAVVLGYELSGRSFLLADDKPAVKALEGIWAGSLKVGGGELRLVVHISKNADGSFSAKLDSPDQGATGIPINTVTFKDDTLRLELKDLKAGYEGKADAKLSAIDGKWLQSGQTFALTLKKTDKLPEVKRPQMPKKPYPYGEEEVVYENKKAGVKFAGTLTLPKGQGPFPAVLLITGSGAHDRDESLMGHKPFLVLADYLTRRGIAVLRVDDRGVGGSTGKKMQSTTDDFAADALTGVDFLKKRKEIHPQQIGLIGHSEGGCVAPLAAARSKDVAFIVLMAGTGLNGEEVLYLQGAAILKAIGTDDQTLARQRRVQEGMFAIAKHEKDDNLAEKKMREVIDKELASLEGDDKKKAEETKSSHDAQIKMVLTPWFRYFLTYDPRPALRKVHCPVLAINGEKDVQVPPKENLAAIEKALAEGGNKNVTVQVLPKLNHLFQTCETGSLSEYAKIEETIAPAALEIMADWILKQTNGKSSGATRSTR